MSAHTGTHIRVQVNPAIAAPTTGSPAVVSSSPPLLAALTGGDAESTAAWKAWRTSVDIEHLAWPDMQILPLLNGSRLEAWLANDPAAGILKGIVRRAWSEAQVRLGTAREVVASLTTAGCDSITVTGALGSYLRSLESTAIRPVLELRLLIPRQHLALAAAALEAEGWQPRDKLPTQGWLDRMSFLYFSRNGTRLYLHWRLLNVDPHRASACEHEFLSDYRAVDAIGTTFRILSPCHALLETLADRAESVDALAWQADSALILRNGEPLDWRRWSAIAARYQPLVFDSLPELRGMGLDVPDLRLPRAHQLGRLIEACLPVWARRISAAVGKA
jgi:hypothetical protein